MQPEHCAVWPEHCAVWPEHWPALELFFGVQTQWRIVAGMGGAQYQGLDYSAVYAHPRLARLGYDEQDERLEQLRHIEAGALEGLNAR
ncbi:DUF1799 domain-containing protein [Modicisalibacter coralii]|uniref:DUF1799 domain-containing protein n=1 Tax=Modicisalibacter coralii TaxID=2304602 RepID=UPI0019397F9A|nr:DUF1799 domain-containing protein [Halomonas coralii]